MKGRHRIMVRDACCVLAAVICALYLSGCEVQPYRAPVTTPIIVLKSTIIARRPDARTAANVVQKARPVTIATAATPPPTSHGPAWQGMPGAVYAAAPVAAAAANVASAVQPRRNAGAAARPQIAAVPVAATRTAAAQVATAQLATPPIMPPLQGPAVNREVHAAPHAFGEIEAEAVRYAGGPCSADIYRIAWAAADLFHIQPVFVAAVIEVESGCRSDAVSVAGARGLMQLIPASGAREGYRFMHGTDRKPTLAELRDPATNIQLGVAYLGALQDHFSYIDAPMPRLILMVAAYNCGPDFIDQRLPAEAQAWSAEQAARWVQRNAPAETRNFVDSVMRKSALYASAATTAAMRTVARN
jgi:soluble lytic murein transglycosylase-like protein